jgi:hypothetical protein
MINKIVVHFADGEIRKGATADFSPNKNILHLSEKESGKVKEINIKDLKAVFFVKSYEGNPRYKDKVNVERVGLGKKIRVEFKDSEKMIGYTQGYSPNRVGFIFFPSDPDSNNEKAFIINDATDNIRFI